MCLIVKLWERGETTDHGALGRSLHAEPFQSIIPVPNPLPKLTVVKAEW